MLVGRDLGISSLALIVCLVFPVIGLLIRRQWRLAEERKAEIRRLLILASEEAARAELEATTVGYTSVSEPPRGYSCAVCGCPTTNRCSQCKAVRYCSGKCQIIHWRQGHKDECRPPRVTWELNDERNDLDWNLVEKDQGEKHCDKLESDDQHHANSAPLSPCEKVRSDSTGGFVEDPHGNAAYVSLEHGADKEEANSVAETYGSSFSGFSSSAPSNESSDDVSLCESISSFESEISGSPLSVDTAVDALESAFSLNDVAPTKPVSPKFTHLIESADNFASSNKIDSVKPDGKPSSFSGSNGDRPEGSVAQSSVMSSDFWGRTLEHIESNTDACDDPALPKSYGSTKNCERSSPKSNGSNNNRSDSDSSLRFSFSSRESTSKAYLSDQITEAPFGTSKSADTVGLSEFSTDTPSVRNLMTHERSTEMGKDKTRYGSRASGSEEFRASVPLLSPCIKPSLAARRVSIDMRPVHSDKSSSSVSESHKAFRDLGSASSPLETEDKQLSSGGSNGNVSTGARGCSQLNIKSVKAADCENGSAVSSQATSFLNGRNGMKTSVLKVVDQFKRSKPLKHHPVASASEIAKRCNDKGHFRCELFVKLYNWNKINLQPCGLINCGNSCYANAVLQCLTFTRPLTAYFLQGFHSKACVRKQWCFTCEFEKLVLKSNQGKTPLSPAGLLSQLQNLGSQLGHGKEEDAHEFLRFAVDIMQAVCVKEAGGDASGAAEREETTLISLTFGGYLRSKIKCMKCHGKSERHERMMDLAVEIEGDISTLEEALRRFTRTEILDGENKYKCERCKSYERAKKKLKILEAPNILTIALKRFQSGKFGKLNKPIRFPETLDLAPYVSGKNDKHLYQLYGVVVHLDIMNAAFSGHYVCYVKNSQNRWFKADDSMVTATELERVLSKDAYMLFYARCSPRVPRSILKRTMSADQKNKALLSRVSGKNTVSLSSSASMNHSVVLCADSPDSQASMESFYSKFHRLQRILEEDSSSESSSLFSNSDECSCTTDSTRDSSSTDELADFIFGDHVHGWRSSPDSESCSSSTSSPLYSGHSPLSDSTRYASTYEAYEKGSRSAKEAAWVRLEGNGSDPFLNSNSSKHDRIFGSSSNSSSSSSFRETDLERLGLANPISDAKHEFSFRKSKNERTK